MKNLIWISILFLFAQCAKQGLSSEASPIEMEVLESYVQREIPGQESIPPSLKVHLHIKHNDRIKVKQLNLLTEQLTLNKYKEYYSATFKKDQLLSFKGKEVNGILFLTVDNQERQVPLVFTIKEDLYLP